MGGVGGGGWEGEHICLVTGTRDLIKCARVILKWLFTVYKRTLNIEITPLSGYFLFL